MKSLFVIVMVVTAGALLATGTPAFSADAAFEQRFQARMGRVTAAEEARLATVAAAAGVPQQECGMHQGGACCSRDHGNQISAVSSNGWLNAKLRRSATAPQAGCTHHEGATMTASPVAETWRSSKFGQTVRTGSALTCCD